MVVNGLPDGLTWADIEKQLYAGKASSAELADLLEPLLRTL
ncbi:hypothetical protein [Pseudenhygromyxa sp. WMMC2535]|nr:hypothetical protein [Pseudenhygromyxa sp. WMMC2535]